MNSAVKSARRLTSSMKVPVVELSECIVCGVCVETCPEVFRLNDAGFIEVIELSVYPKPGVAEAIKYCPVDCIHWET
jgi:ferredoxin